MFPDLARFSLVTAITVTIVLATTAGVITVGSVLWSYSRAVREDLSGRVLATASEKAVEAIEHQLDDAERATRVGAAVLLDALADGEPLVGHLRIIAAQVTTRPHLTAVYLFTAGGDYAGARRWPDDEISVAFGPWGEPETISRYQWLASEGRLGPHLGQLTFDPRTRGYYRDAVATGGTIWTPPYRDALNQELALTTATPVYGGDGSLAGVVAVDLHLMHLRRLLAELTSTPGSEVIVLDPQQRYLAGSADPSGSGVARESPPAFAALLAAYRQSCGAAPQGAAGCSFELSSGGSRVLAQAATARSTGGLEWRVLATAPEEDFLQYARGSERLAARLAVIGTLLAMLLGWALSNHIVRPIRALTQLTTGLGDPARQELRFPRSFRELNHLGHTLVTMHRQLTFTMSSLEEERERLEWRVEERTRELAEANERLTRLVSLDALTGIANRRRFDEILTTEWQRAVRSGLTLSLLLCDIDFFKPYNDTFGHQAGDDCLRAVAHAIHTCVRRPTDLVARFGGDEFAVLLPDTNEHGARAVAERIRQAVEALDLGSAVDEMGDRVTLSLGLASGPAPHLRNPGSLIDATDRALYRAKELGRNRVAVTWSFAPHSFPARPVRP
jgi:diguanylate cyclase (GGDEF)-like protein